MIERGASEELLAFGKDGHPLTLRVKGSEAFEPSEVLPRWGKTSVPEKPRQDNTRPYRMGHAPRHK